MIIISLSRQYSVFLELAHPGGASQNIMDIDIAFTFAITVAPIRRMAAEYLVWFNATQDTVPMRPEYTQPV